MNDASQLTTLVYTTVCFVTFLGFTSLCKQLWNTWERGDSQGLWAGGLLGASLGVFTGIVLLAWKGLGFLPLYVLIVGGIVGGMWGAALGAMMMPRPGIAGQHRFTRIEPFWTQEHSLPSIRALTSPPTPREVAAWTGRKLTDTVRWALRVPDPDAPRDNEVPATHETESQPNRPAQSSRADMDDAPSETPPEEEDRPRPRRRRRA